MASAEQLKALLQSHLDGDDARFYSIAMQIAAHEARLGHGKLAKDLRAIIDAAKSLPAVRPGMSADQSRSELGNLLEVSYPKSRLEDMILSTSLSDQIQRVIREQRYAEKILENGLSPRRKLLLVGPPGTGKTLTAFVIASELGLPLLQVRLDGLITKFMGETATKLRQVFDFTYPTRGVYLFDEFDAIGSQRGLANDVGEIRRVLNSFLQMIEQNCSHSLIVAATNHSGILDPALFRRFDDILHYELPDEGHIVKLLKTRLLHTATKRIRWQSLGEVALGLNYAEVTRAANEVLKDALIHQQTKIGEAEIRKMVNERKKIAEKLGANRHRG